jgi:heat shock protein HtpX
VSTGAPPYTTGMADWLSRIDKDGTSLAAYRGKRVAAVVVSLAYILFWMWFGFVVGFCVTFVAADLVAGEGAGAGAALAIGAAGAVIAAPIATFRAIHVWLHGTEKALRAVAARPADKAHDQRLLDIVDELSLAGGQKPPAIYVIDSSSLNAFATTGRRGGPSIVVTAGLCESLTRAELAAIVGHELTHIRDHDGVLPIFVGVLVGSMAAESKVQGQSRRGFVLWIPAFLCWGLAGLLGGFATAGQATLTDLDSIELTRDPGALADALEKMRHASTSLAEGEAAVAQLLTVPPAEGLSGTRMEAADSELGRRIAALRKIAP